MSVFQKSVREFHVMGSYATAPAPVELRDAESRAHLMAEEPIETVIALVGTARAPTIVIGELQKSLEKAAKRKQSEPDLVEAIDGCLDTLVVTFGTLETLGLDEEEVELLFREVMWANMAKRGGPVDPATGKLLKPPGWRGPDIAGVLELIRARRATTVAVKQRCDDCGAEGAMPYLWGSDGVRWLCGKCVGPAYERWKAEEEESYP